MFQKHLQKAISVELEWLNYQMYSKFRTNFVLRSNAPDMVFLTSLNSVKPNTFVQLTIAKNNHIFIRKPYEWVDFIEFLHFDNPQKRREAAKLIGIEKFLNASVSDMDFRYQELSFDLTMVSGSVGSVRRSQ